LRSLTPPTSSGSARSVDECMHKNRATIAIA
jgi:hypothetical protein